MSELIVIAYDTPHKADEVRMQLIKLGRKHLLDLEDAAVVSKDAQGKVKLRQTQNLTVAGALSGGFWGLLIGTLFLNPFLGAAVGAGTGAVTGSFTDLGVNDAFMRELGSSLHNNTSAMFVLLKNASPDKFIHEITPYGGKVLQTSLSDEDEARLREAVEHTATLQTSQAT